VRGGGQIAKLFSNLSLPVSLQPKAPPILMRPAPLGGELTMRSLLLALVVATAASPARAADQIPTAFHGDWCSIAGKDDKASTASTSRLTVIPTRWAIAKSLASWKLGKLSWLTLIAAPRVVIRKSSQSVCGCAWTHAISSICGSPASRLARAADHRPEPFLSTDGGAAPFRSAWYLPLKMRLAHRQGQRP
jgi:hypothetical protein